MGRLLSDQMAAKKAVKKLSEVEFKVCSQFGDDGIIQYLIHNMDVSNRRFIEFGVEDYTECNTRFLLLMGDWSGLIIDGSAENIRKVKRSEIYWKYDLKAEAAFVTRENIDEIFSRHSFSGEIGLLSIDIDGNDYWIWEKIEVVKPDIVVVEFNSVFGGERKITIPYDAAFARTGAHFSNLYYGCSLGALCHLAERKGYYLVGCNSAGNNAYFVRKEKIGNLSIFTAREGYVDSKFKESRDQRGKLTFHSGKERRKIIAGLPVFNVETNSTEEF